MTRPTLMVVEGKHGWPEIPGAQVIDATTYLTKPDRVRGAARVLNLCRSLRYQSAGYYVSLLAEARGHKVLPTLTTLQDLESEPLRRAIGEDLDADVARMLAGQNETPAPLRVVLGRSLDGRYPKLASALFRTFPAPCLEVAFERAPNGQWRLARVRSVGVADVPESEQGALEEAVVAFLRARMPRTTGPSTASFDLAILHDPTDPEPPSNASALKRFIAVAKQLGIEASLIEKRDYRQLPEYDALFIRETTRVNHHTYRFARRAAAEGMPVIDDPASILRCTNKVYLAETLERAGVRTPTTRILHKGNVASIGRDLGFPVVLKLPDSSFSQGVIRVDDAAALERAAREMLRRSDLIVAQRFVPTEFDWRVGVFEGKPLWACRYYMARKHWQIVRRDERGKKLEGDHDTLPIDQVPASVLDAALRACACVGDGLYGVDLKELEEGAVVMEVNDNPNLDGGVEDSVLGETLYRTILEGFLARLEKLRGVRRSAS